MFAVRLILCLLTFKYMRSYRHSCQTAPTSIKDPKIQICTNLSKKWAVCRIYSVDLNRPIGRWLFFETQTNILQISGF
jgi:hypothetical protein